MASRPGILRPGCYRFRSSIHQRGQVLILFGLSLIVLIGAVGLAVDSGRAYGVRARLNAAVDAASIAAARALAIGADDAARISNAQAAAARFFQLNYPADFLGSTPSAPTTSAVREASGRWRVSVSATANMPTSFIRVLGRTDVGVAAAGEAIRRDLDVVLVMDTSGSLGPPYSPASTFPTLKSAAINGFIKKFSSGAGGDRVGLVSFSSGAVLDVPINRDATRGFDSGVIQAAINALPLGGATASAEGMRRGLDELNTVPVALRSSLRVILFFSDGAPNLVSGTFPRSSGSPNPITGNLYSDISGSGSGAADRMWRDNARNDAYYAGDADGSGSTITNISSLPSTGAGGIPLASFDGKRTLTGSPYQNTRCNVNKAARNMVERVANTARGDDIRIYTIGLGDPLNTLETSFSGGNCGYTLANEKGSTILKRLANSADSDSRNDAQPQGLYCHAATATDLDRCFSTIASEILRLTL